jgi:hypothetical protein
VSKERNRPDVFGRLVAKVVVAKVVGRKERAGLVDKKERNTKKNVEKERPTM